MFVPDLGLDSIVAYDFDEMSGHVAANPARSAASVPGAGPRYMEIHGSGRFAYTVNELSSTITASTYDARAMTLSAFQEITTLPAEYKGSSTCADLHIGASGRFLYASNRGHDSIAIYMIDQATGRLEALGHESTRGGVPRNFTLDATGQWMLVANQDTDQIVLYHVDAITGMLEFSGTELKVPTPVCVRTFLV
jgi:6-phosphogluconolactonase